MCLAIFARQAAISQMFQFGPLQEVINLLHLSPEEVTTLQDDLISFLKVQTIVYVLAMSHYEHCTGKGVLKLCIFSGAE